MERDGKRAKERAGLLALLGRYKYVLLVALAGVVCLLWPTDSAGDGTAAESVAVPLQSELQETEREMEEILSKIHGVGEVKVMLTLDRGKESVLAEDSSLSYSGDTRAPEDYSRSSQPVILSGDDEEVVVRQEVYPRFRGALVVCRGGGDSAVQLAVIGAVSALTGLGADKISVLKWQE